MKHPLFDARGLCEDCGRPYGRWRLCGCQLVPTWKAGAVLGVLIMWAAAGKLMAQTPGAPLEQGTIPATIWISSIVATALFTWKLAKYDGGLRQRIDQSDRARAQARAQDRARMGRIEGDLRRILVRLEKHDGGGPGEDDRK